MRRDENIKTKNLKHSVKEDAVVVVCTNGRVLQQHSWLRHCATSRKVAGLIPDGVTGIFYWHKPSRLHYGLGVDSDSNRN
jgi:hypothetical protein